MFDRESASSATSRSRIRRGDLVLLIASAGMLAAYLGFDERDFPQPPPDFSAMTVEERKPAFFGYLGPFVEATNRRFAADRDRVRAISKAYASGHAPSWIDRLWLGRLAEQLEVPLDEIALDESLEVLERRVGIVPESLVLVQAALESGWGTSRFALEGNNYFGQRCYRDGCGIAPEGRGNEAGFGLARFASPAESVESFVLNLNTHPNYREFRMLRQSRRDAGLPITGLSLAHALEGYSERGSDYVADITAMIRANALE